jgi:rhodanese-related sulfurtransferase
MKINLNVILVILIASSLLGLFYNYFSPTGIPLIAKERTLKWAEDSLLTDSFNEVPDTSDFKQENQKTNITNNTNPDTVQTKTDKKITAKDKQNEEPKKVEPVLIEPAAINLNQAYGLFNQNILFIDAREPADYQYAHIKNAINIPFDRFDEYKHLIDKIDKDQPVITYCAGTDCDLSILLGNLLFETGYKRVYIFFGGWNEWTEANYPVEQGAQTE